jgi:hypothetical protein
MLLNSFCMLDVAPCSPRTTVVEAAHLMRRHHTGPRAHSEDGAAEVETEADQCAVTAPDHWRKP